MRIRWRGLELPGRVAKSDGPSSESYGRFTVEPFEQGFGTTIGNSLRRVLLSSLEGAAITAMKIEGVAHEFTSIDGVLEDVTDIVLNVKGLIVRLDGDGPMKITVSRQTAGAVTGGDIECDPSVTIVNKDHHLATLTSDINFTMEMTIDRGRGYATAAQNRRADQEIGVIPVDSVFSPVVRVRFRTEDMRVDDRTNYDRLILEVWTKGTVLPEDALVEAGMILRKHLNPFVMYHELGEQIGPVPASTEETSTEKDSALEELLSKSVSILNLSVRASNCLEAARINTLRDLVTKTESDLLRVRSFGKTSLDEVESKLAEMNLALGMKLDGDSSGSTMPGQSLGPIGGTFGGGQLPGGGIGPTEVFTMGD
ncbi:MAG: DNA-directed RNA polymerase subunit alpha [Phycisphaerae bacterium]